MAIFLSGNKLNAEIENLFLQAKASIILISPYIKLHDRFSRALLTHQYDPNVKITLVFGKNKDYSKSMQKEDFDFFKQFPNIEILFENNLHAKYYANEKNAIISSMNLHSFSNDNNIEVGILVKGGLLKTISNNLITTVTGEDNIDVEAWNYFHQVCDQATILYDKEPEFEKTLLTFRSKYKDSIVHIDELSTFFESKISSPIQQINETNLEKLNGFCIRTGVPIPFNIEKPMTDAAYDIWLKYKNPDFSEKYCHYSGEPSHGETTFSHPILRKNWNRAKLRIK